LKPPYLTKRFTPEPPTYPVDNSQNPLDKAQKNAVRFVCSDGVVSRQR